MGEEVAEEEQEWLLSLVHDCCPPSVYLVTVSLQRKNPQNSHKSTFHTHTIYVAALVTAILSNEENKSKVNQTHSRDYYLSGELRKTTDLLCNGIALFTKFTYR